MKTWQKVAYSVGSLGSSLPAQAFGTFIIFYYVDILKVPAVMIGKAWVIYGLWNAINDPLFGYWSDRTRSRWGRRIPWMVGGLLPLLLSFVMVWIPPHTGPDTLFWYFLGSIFLFDTFYTIVILNWTSLFPEMFPSLGERAQVSAWRQGFNLLGLILGTALAPMIYGSLGWAAMAVIFAVVTGIAMLISLLGSRENPNAQLEEPLNVAAAIKSTLANRSFLTYVLSSTFVQFTFVLLMATIPFYTKHVLKLDDMHTSLVMLSIFIVTFVMLAPWTRWIVRFGPRAAFMYGCVLFGAMLGGFWAAHNFTSGVIAAALMGLGLPGLIILLDVLIADVIDEDQVHTGLRREGMYFGVNALFIRLGLSVQGIVMGKVLTAYGYDPHLAVQPASALTGIRILLTAVPAAALVVALAFIWFYPLHGKRLADVKAALTAQNESAASGQ